LGEGQERKVDVGKGLDIKGVLVGLDSFWKKNKRPLLVGIAGGSGSGKSTLANAVLKTLGGRVQVIEQDSYYACCSRLTTAQRNKHNFDHPDAVELSLLSNHLKELKAGRSIERPFYDFSTHSRLNKTESVEPTPVIIVEGLFLFVEIELRELFDLRVFVDADADTRLQRRIKRDVAERGRTKESVIEQYYVSVKPMHDKFIAASEQWAHCRVDTESSDGVKVVFDSFLSVF
jgi:uridine kinase